MTAPKRQAPPPLIIQAPACPLCLAEVSVDADEFRCEDCDCCWPIERDYDATGYWNVNEAEQCESVIAPYQHLTETRFADIKDHRDRCLLDADHEGQHRSGDIGQSWNDDNTHLVPLAEATP